MIEQFADNLFALALPALLSSLLAQLWTVWTQNAAGQVPTKVSGCAATRALLDAASLDDIAIEEFPGQTSALYDPRDRVVRLSSDTYHGRHATAVGVALHEAGHALRRQERSVAETVRSIAVVLAMFGTSAAAVLVLLGMILQQSPLWTAGIWLFAASVYYQLINLPVEWVASARSRAVLLQTGVLTADELPAVQRVMNAAVVGLLATATQSLLTLPLWILNRVRR